VAFEDRAISRIFDGSRCAFVTAGLENHVKEIFSVAWMSITAACIAQAGQLSIGTPPASTRHNQCFSE